MIMFSYTYSHYFKATVRDINWIFHRLKIMAWAHHKWNFKNTGRNSVSYRENCSGTCYASPYDTNRRLKKPYFNNCTWHYVIQQHNMLQIYQWRKVHVGSVCTFRISTSLVRSGFVTSESSVIHGGWTRQCIWIDTLYLALRRYDDGKSIQ